MITYLLKPGELTLKGGNRPAFERILKRNLSAHLSDCGAGPGVRITLTQGRFFVTAPEGEGEGEGEAVEEALDRLIGIAGWAKARTSEKTAEAVIASCVDEGINLAAGGFRTFKVEARRTDKSFPLSSYEIRCRAGDAVREAAPGLAVDVRHPEAVINVEIRERAYIYGFTRPGRRGLPVGSAGRGLLLLSGGIDSPVAGYLMLTRGMGLDAVYFHAWPLTPAGARDKAETLAGLLARYGVSSRLFVVPFLDVETRIKERSPERWRTVLLRRAMMDCADRLARRLGAKCLITGESLAQVASQTVENLACTGGVGVTALPVLRPLIGLDKEEIIRRASALGSYETSVLPYEDCCVLFSPPHPVLRGDPSEAASLYEALEVPPLLEASLEAADTVRFGGK